MTPAHPVTPRTPPARTHRVNLPSTQTAHPTRTEKVNHGMVEAEMGHRSPREDARRTLGSGGSMDASTFAPIKARLHQPALSTVQILRKPPLGVPKYRVRVPLRQPGGPPGPRGGGGRWLMVGQESATGRPCGSRTRWGPYWRKQRGGLKCSARAVQLFGRLAVLETHALRS